MNTEEELEFFKKRYNTESETDNVRYEVMLIDIIKRLEALESKK